MLTLVGDEDRCKIEEEGDWRENDGEEEEKVDDEIEEAQNLPEGDSERSWRDVAAIVIEEREIDVSVRVEKRNNF